MRATSINFVTAVGQIIQTKEIGIVLISFARGDHIKLYNITLVPRCNSNLISVGQLCKSGITYYNNSITMILISNGKVIIQIKKDRNLFTFDFIQLGKAMTVINKKLKTMAIIR